MSVFYVALFLACLTGVCTFVVIGDELRHMYIDWLASTDSFTSNGPAPRSRHAHIESSLMHKAAPSAAAYAMPRSVRP
jgi:hypothetical protein